MLSMLPDAPDPDTFAIRMQTDRKGNNRLEEKSAWVQSPAAGLTAGARITPARARRPGVPVSHQSAAHRAISLHLRSVPVVNDLRGVAITVQ